MSSVYKEHLNSGVGVDPSRLMILEFTGFLENYLWPHFDAAAATFEHIMCIMLVRLLPLRTLHVSPPSDGFSFLLFLLFHLFLLFLLFLLLLPTRPSRVPDGD